MHQHQNGLGKIFSLIQRRSYEKENLLILQNIALTLFYFFSQALIKSVITTTNSLALSSFELLSYSILIVNVNYGVPTINVQNNIMVCCKLLYIFFCIMVAKYCKDTITLNVFTNHALQSLQTKVFAKH